MLIIVGHSASDLPFLNVSASLPTPQIDCDSGSKLAVYM